MKIFYSIDVKLPQIPSHYYDILIYICNFKYLGIHKFLAQDVQYLKNSSICEIRGTLANKQASTLGRDGKDTLWANKN